MIIECINCAKKFDVNAELIPADGRTIQCGSCNHVWFFKINNQNKSDFLINDAENDEEVFKFPEYLEQNLIKLDKKFIDFNFHTYMRHMGNKTHAKQYLKWETDLLEEMDKEEINFFKIGNVNVEN